MSQNPIDELLKAALARRSGLKGGKFVPSVSEVQMRDLIEIAFQASLEAEEERFPRVTLFVANDADPPCPCCGEVLFTEPIPLNADAVKRLAQVVPLPCHAIKVEPRGSQFVCTGIIRSSWGVLEGAGPNLSNRSRDGLNITIEAPARIAVKEDFFDGGVAVRGLSLVSGREYMFDPIWFLRELDNISDLIQEQVGDGPAVDPLINGSIEWILATTAKRHHGGLFLISRSGLNDVNNMVSGGFLCNGPHLGEALEAYARERIHGEKTERIKSLSPVLNAMTCISHLAQLDGAVVLDHNLRVHCFGAAVTTDSKSEDTVILLNSEFGETDQSILVTSIGGQRRTAAVRFAMKVEHGVAFVVSQDGDIRVARNLGKNRAGISPPIAMTSSAWPWSS